MPQAKTTKAAKAVKKTDEPKLNKPKATKPAAKATAKTASQAKTRQGAPKAEAADSIRATNEPVVVDGNYQPLPVEHRLPDVSDLPDTYPDVHGVSAKLNLANKDEPTPTDTVKVGGESIELVHSPTNVDPVVLGSQRHDTVLKDRARSQGKAHLVDTPHETLEGRLRAGDSDDVVKLPGEPKPTGRSTLPPANHTENEVQRGIEIAENQKAAADA